MANKWREVWERRDIDKDILSSGDYKNVYLALKIFGQRIVRGSRV